MKKKKTVFLAAGAMLLVMMVFATQGSAGVSVGIGINIPPFRFATAPSLVVIPGTYAYYPPETDLDIVFYGGYWYRPYEGNWFRARGYNGPWAYVEIAHIPHTVLHLPPNYRHVYREHPRIVYRDFHKHWRGWERSRHWESDNHWRSGKDRHWQEARLEHRRERGHERHWKDR